MVSDMKNERPRVTAEALLAAHATILDALRDMGIARTANNPAGDYAEHLAAAALGLELAPNAQLGYDALGPDGTRYQVKSRYLAEERSSRQLGAIRELDQDPPPFDVLVGILFGSGYRVLRAAAVPVSVVRAQARWTQRVNAWRFMLTDQVWAVDGVVDITERIRAATGSTSEVLPRRPETLAQVPVQDAGPRTVARRVPRSLAVEAFLARTPTRPLPVGALVPSTLREPTASEAARGVVIAHHAKHFDVCRSVFDRLMPGERVRIECTDGAVELGADDLRIALPNVVASASYQTGTSAAPNRCHYTWSRGIPSQLDRYRAAQAPSWPGSRPTPTERLRSEPVSAGSATLRSTAALRSTRRLPLARLVAGEEYHRRDELHPSGLGANQPKGISYPRHGDHVLLFHGGHGAAVFGYQDGWDGPSFRYYGEFHGPGDMRMSRGNRAIIDRSPHIYLFTATKSAWYRFEGRFECIGHEWSTMRFRGRIARSIIFRLRKVADVVELR